MPDYGRGKRPLDKPTRREERLRRDRDAIQKALDRFTDVKLRELVDRGERGVKGSVEVDGERVGDRAKGEVPKPTERQALKGLPDDPDAPDVWRNPSDPIGETIRGIASLLDLAKVTMEEAEDRLLYVLNLTAEEFAVLGRHKTAAICRACDRTVTGSADDRLRAGYCQGCHQAWLRRLAAWTEKGRPGAPDRHAFERERRQRAAAELEQESA